MIKNLLLALYTASVSAAQPDGVTSPEYDCTYDANQAYLLEVVVTDDDVDIDIRCGELYREGSANFDAIKAPVFAGGNDPKLKMRNALDDDYYTIVLSNSDDSIAIGPLIHQMIGNIKGSDLKAGF